MLPIGGGYRRFAEDGAESDNTLVSHTIRNEMKILNIIEAALSRHHRRADDTILSWLTTIMQGGGRRLHGATCAAMQ